MGPIKKVQKKHLTATSGALTCSCGVALHCFHVYFSSRSPTFAFSRATYDGGGALTLLY